MNYQDFREERDYARASFRDHLAAQSEDQSERGASVWPAYQLMRRMYVLDNPIQALPDGWLRKMWKTAYQMQRAQDAENRNIIRRVHNAAIPGMIAALVNDKIKRMIGDA